MKVFSNHNLKTVNADGAKTICPVSQFYQIPIDKSSMDLDTDILEMLQTSLKLQHNSAEDERDRSVPFVDQLNAFDHQLEDLLALLKQAKRYTGEVVSGEIEGDLNFGRALSRDLTSQGVMDSEKFQKMISGQVKDQLMVNYLSHLTRAQIALANNISSILAAQASEV
jgi:hypothetical protein